MTAIVKEPNVAAALKNRLSGVILIAGVGNTLRSDDGAGPRLVELLGQRLHRFTKPTSCVHLIDCHETPENYVGSIARLRPDSVVVVDSASLGLPAGQTRIVEADDLVGHSPSTHGMSLALFMNRLKEETQADVFMLAVQPSATSFGESLSLPVGRALVDLADLIEIAIQQM